jgi:microcystin-dependent protein
MTQPYVGEVRMFGGNFAPAGWALCNGASMSISNNTVLYQLIGTTYGGDGVNTFNLPNLQARLAVGMGQGTGLSNYVLGQAAGSETVTITTSQLPSHNHPLRATTTAATLNTPGGNLTGQPASGARMYTSTNTPLVNLNSASCTMTQGNMPHQNMMPFQCVTFIIALYGIFPSQS